jgi:hypothetical protein
MNNLFVFGCSFTEGNGCHLHEPYAKKYKKSEDDLIWPEYVAKKLNLNLHNFGRGLTGNDRIIDSIIDNYNKITEGDIVILQKSFSHRFDVSNTNQYGIDCWQTITPTSLDSLKEIGYYDDDILSLTKTLSIIDSDLNNQRWIRRFNFFKKILISDKKVKACIFWDLESGYHVRLKKIVEVDPNINDGHWSYEGHREFANEILEKLKNYE